MSNSNANAVPATASRSRTHKLTVTAMLSAVAFVLMFIEFPIPALIPSFVKMDISDLPELLAAFSLGPVYGVAVTLLKNLLHILFKGTSSAYVGELCNFLLGVLLVLPAGLICRKRPGFKGAVIGALSGTAAMAFGSILVNGLITYPFYASVMMPMEVIMDMYRALIPGINNLWQALLVFNVPFTAVKGLCAAAVALPLYRSLSPALRRVKEE